MHIAMLGPSSPRTLRDLLDSGSDAVPDGLGGSPVNHLVRALHAAGHEVTLMTLCPAISSRHDLCGDRLKIVALPWREKARDRARDMFRVERSHLESALRDVSPDVVHAHWTYEYAWAAILAPFPTLVTIHDAPVTVLRFHRDAYRAIRLLMASRVRVARPHMSAVSPYAAERWRLEMLDRRGIPVVPNIVPPSPLRSSGESRRVAMVGNAGKGKNMAAGIEAFLLAKRTLPDLELTVIGPSLDKNSVLARSVAARPGADSITFLGRVAERRVLEEFAATAVLLHPSLEETHGMVISEAQQCGVSVVAGSRSGGVPWSLGDGEAGLLVDVTSPAAMAEALVSLFTDKRLRRSLVRAGDRLVRTRYSPAAVTAAYEAEYDRVLATPRRGV